MKTQVEKVCAFLTQNSVLLAVLFFLTCIGVTCSRVGANSGEIPARTATATLRSTTTATTNISLQLPAATEWAAPAGAPIAPGDRYPIMFSTSAVMSDPAAPVISGWNITAKPDESFTLSGIRFTTGNGTDIGSDTTVWIWADTPSGGILKQAKLWNVSKSTLTALVPNDVPFGMYMIWVENSVGASTPICLNRGTLNWLGPLGATVQPGGTKRIFGKNLSTGHGTTTAYVYLQPATGGALAPLPVKSVEPYAVEFTVPTGTATGSYKVYLHNGHGGRYGWGAPLNLWVAKPWVRSNSEVVVSASGTDDSTAIQNAINRQNGLANGGTVRLKSGTYTIAAPLSLTSKVRLAGAGKDATKVAIRLASPASTGLALIGDQSAVQDLTIIQAQNPVQPTYGPIKSRFPEPVDDVKLVNVRVTADAGTPYGTIDLHARQGEVVGCEADRILMTSGSDIWVHHSKFYGGTYDMTEAATYTNGNNFVMERNHFQTDWPTGPHSSRNYLDFIPSSDLLHRVWAKRVFYTAPQYGSVEHSYIAWNTTKDVAVDDNRGEMILFHGVPSKWYAQVAASSGTTLTIRTDGLIDGQARNVDGVGAATEVPASLVYGVVDRQAYVVIIAGTGLGQARQVIDHGPTSLTVDSPWRIPPAPDSKIVLTFLARDHVVYKNDLNAFPKGYKLSYSASQGVDFDGNVWESVSEGNTSHRSYSARTFGGLSTGPGYWNEMRDETAYNNYHSGMNMVVWDFSGYDALGPAILGNMLHGATLTVQPLQQQIGPGPISMLNAQISPYEGGEIDVGQNVILNSVFENIVGSGSTVGIRADQWTKVLFRNNTVAVVNNQVRMNRSVPQPVLIRKYADPIFSANSYSGATQKYTQATGSTFKDKPMALYRVAHFQGHVGQTFEDVKIPILNAGVANMTWSVSASDPWITASVQSGGTVKPEAATGRLQVNVNTSRMGSGKHWGTVRLTTACSKVFTIGVEVKLL